MRILELYLLALGNLRTNCMPHGVEELFFNSETYYNK